MFLFFISISCWSCAQEPLSDTINHCLYSDTEPLQSHNILGSDNAMVQWQVVGPDYQHPHFNPNNLNEIAFQKSTEIWVLDMCTGNKQRIAENIYTLYDWSKQGWLIFNTPSQDLYKVKPNGDSLTRLTTYGIYNTGAICNPTGDKYLYRKVTNDGTFGIIADINGRHLDTINRIPSASHWFEENRISYKYDSGIFIYDIAMDELEKIDNLPGNFLYLHTNSSFYLPTTNNLVWDARQYIFSTNLATHERIIIKQGSTSQQYNEFDIAPDHSTIIVIRSDKSPTDTYIVEERKHLCLMNIDGSYERRILLDW